MHRYTWQGDYSRKCESGHTLYLSALVLCVLWVSVYAVWVLPSHTHTTKNGHSRSCPNTTFCFTTGMHTLIKNNPPQSRILSLATGCNPNSSLSLTHTYTHRLTALCVLECLKNVFDLICSQALFFRSCLFYMQIMYASWTRWIIITDVISFYLSPNHFPIKTQGKVILQLPFAQCLLKDWMKSSLF